MSNISDNRFGRGQNLSARHLNDMQEVTKNTRKGIRIDADGAIVNSRARSDGNSINIRILPEIYKVVSVSDGGNSSSSSSVVEDTSHAYVQKVRISTGATFGPVLKVRIP